MRTNNIHIETSICLDIGLIAAACQGSVIVLRQASQLVSPVSRKAVEKEIDEVWSWRMRARIFKAAYNPTQRCS